MSSQTPPQSKSPPNYSALLWENRKQFASVKLMVLLTFWLIFLIEGIYALYYCDLLQITINIWKTDSSCSGNSLFNGSDTLEGQTIYDLAELGLSQGTGWLLLGLFGSIGTFAVWLYFLYNIYRLDNKYYFEFNYWFSHVLSIPMFTLVSGVSQGLIVSQFGGSLFASLVLTDSNEGQGVGADGKEGYYYYEYSFDDDGCGAWEDVYEYTGKVLIVSEIAFVAFILYSFIIPLVVTVMYCVRGKVIFKQKKEYHCFVCLRPLHRFGKHQWCLYCDSVCCVANEAPERMDRRLELYNSTQEF